MAIINGHFDLAKVLIEGRGVKAASETARPRSTPR